MTMINGNTKLISHIVYPTYSFKAPMIYNPYFEKYGIDAVVIPMGCKPDDYPAFLKLVFKLSNIHGALITTRSHQLASGPAPPLRSSRERTGSRRSTRQRSDA